MPFGVLGLAAAGERYIIGRWVWALCYAPTFNRVVMAVVAGWGVVRDPRALRLAWLYPVRAIMGFFFWCASYSGRKIEWRGDWYRLERDGRMVLVRPGPATIARTLADTEAATPAITADRYT